MPPLPLESHRVPDDIAPMRLSDYLPGVFQATPSRKGIKKAIDRGEVWVNGEAKATAYRVQPGDEILLMPRKGAAPKPLNLPIPILYADVHLAVAIKPAGLPVSGNQYQTLVNALSGKLLPTVAPDALPWAMPVHRLDAPTHGLILLARSRQAQHTLSAAFANREVEKTYEAIVSGRLQEKAGALDSPLEGKPACTRYRVLRTTPDLHSGQLSWVEAYPETGRTHQIRKHLSMAGAPILGDAAYTPEGQPLLKHKGLFLAATGLKLQHPATRAPLQFSAAPPDKFESVFKRAGARWQKFHK